MAVLLTNRQMNTAGALRDRRKDGYKEGRDESAARDAGRGVSFGPSVFPVRPVPSILAACMALFASRAIRADDLEKGIALPVSPGSMALLTSWGTTPGVSARLQEGLKSTNPKTRGASARAIDVAMLREAVPALTETLVSETDAAAALEEMRALADSGNSEAPAMILDAAHRFTGRLDPQVVWILARAQGTAALPLYFESLRQLTISEYTRILFFEEATRGKADALVAAAALAFGHRDSQAWQAVLNAAARTGASLYSPLLQTALRSDLLVFRGEAAWYLAKNYCGKPPSESSELLAALSQGEPEVGVPVDPELHFGAELLRRVLGQAPVEDGAWIACLESSTTCHLDSDFGESPLLVYLTEREREAVVRRNAASRSDEQNHNKKDARPKTTPVPAQADQTLLRLVSGLPEGVAEDLLKIEPCKAQSSRYSVAVLEFRSDGAPRRVQLKLVADGSGCARVANALFLMSWAADDVADPAADHAAYLALLLPAVATCANVPLPSPQGPSAQDTNVLRVRGKIEPPKLETRVEPQYPEDARRRHEQGVSIYEGIVTETGCITNVHLLRSSSPELDMMGMEAVAQWRYRPARLNGRPVRVYLTVTVTYRLGR